MGMRLYLEQQSQIVYDAICEAYDPWNPGKVTCIRTDGLYGPGEIVIQIENLGEYVIDLSHVVYEEDFTKHVANELFQKIRYRSAKPTDDHIILGEE